ncbi:hypothetical protein HMPREF9151_02600, partial [Hoylesella saccharolytica F0055]
TFSPFHLFTLSLFHLFNVVGGSSSPLNLAFAKGEGCCITTNIS